MSGQGTHISPFPPFIGPFSYMDIYTGPHLAVPSNRALHEEHEGIVWKKMEFDEEVILPILSEF